MSAECTKPICHNGCMFPQDCPNEKAESSFAAPAGYAAMLDDIEIIRQKIASVKDSCDGSNTGLAIDDALWSALMALNRAESAAKNAA